MDPFERVRADLAAERLRRLAGLAVGRGWLPADVALPPGPPEKALAEAGLSASRIEELLRALDAPSAGRYLAAEKLGEGAAAVVHRGTDRELGRPVALKFMREGVLADEKARERFRREAQSLARMDHPHVVKVHDAGTDGDRMFLVMELVEGGSLGRLLAKEPPGSRRVLALIEQAARGVQHAHERGVVHRDLKPENILVSTGGDAKVADFGLARVAAGEASLTRTGAVLGTPLYMAPEQVRGREATPATDVYALGAILHQALTGRPPFEGDAVDRVYDRILNDEPPRPEGPAGLVALKAMEKDPARRYPTAAAFADDLRRFLDGVAVTARPSSPVWRRLARQRVAVGLAALALAAAALGAAAWARGRARVEAVLEEARSAESEKRLRAARDAYLAARSLDPGNADAAAGADRTELALARVSALLETARPHLERAVAATYDARVPLEVLHAEARSAMSRVAEALSLDDGAVAQARMGEVLEIQGWYPEAEAAYRRAVQREPGLGPVQYRLGRVLLWRGWLESLQLWSRPDPADRERGERMAREGLAAIEAAREAGSGFDDALRREAAGAMIAYLQGKAEETARRCAEAARRFAGREGAEEFAWLEGLVAKEPAAKRAKFDEALRIRPRYPLALYARGWAGGGHDDYSAAIACAPGFAEPYIFRGSARVLSMKDYRAGLDDFDVLVRRGVHLAPAYNGRALAKLRLGDLEGAVADATEALKIRPHDYHLPWVHRAEARLLKGDFEGAVADATKALEIVPPGHGQKPLAVRGRAKAAKGDRDGARADLAAAGPEGAVYLKELDAR